MKFRLDTHLSTIECCCCCFLFLLKADLQQQKTYIYAHFHFYLVCGSKRDIRLAMFALLFEVRYKCKSREKKMQVPSESILSHF